MSRSQEEAHKGTKKARVWRLKWAVCAEVTRHRQHLLHGCRDAGEVSLNEQTRGPERQ